LSTDGLSGHARDTSILSRLFLEFLNAMTYMDFLS